MSGPQPLAANLFAQNTNRFLDRFTRVYRAVLAFEDALFMATACPGGQAVRFDALPQEKQYHFLRRYGKLKKLYTNRLKNAALFNLYKHGELCQEARLRLADEVERICPYPPDDCERPQLTADIICRVWDIVKIVSANQSRREKAEKMTSQPKSKLPSLGTHDKQAYQLSMLRDMTQKRIAEELNREYGTHYVQGHISRMIGRAKKHADASSLTTRIPPRAKPASSIDPERLELGQRNDKHTKRQREKLT